MEVHRNPKTFHHRIRDQREWTLDDVSNNIDSSCIGLGNYSKSWIELQLHAGIMFILRNVATKKRAGFALCTVRSNSIYVDILCAKEKGIGGGQSLIRAIENEARQLGLRYIELVSLRFGPTISFYKKMGFKRGPPGRRSINESRSRGVYKEIGRLMEVYTFTGKSKSKMTPQYGYVSDSNRALRKRVVKKIRKIGPYLARPDYTVVNELTGDHPVVYDLQYWNDAIYYMNKNESSQHLPKYHKNVASNRIA